MRLRLERGRPEGLVDQARAQIISALHAGLLRKGECLPSLRSVARLSKLNVKTVMRVYTHLQREGLLEIREGSGAFLRVHDPGEFEPAQAFRVGRLLRRHVDEAAGMNLSPETYAALTRSFVTRDALADRSVAVLECNQEQVHLYSKEIARRIGVRTHPVLLSELRKRKAVATLRASSILAITDFHPREGKEIAEEYGKPLVRLRLRRDFIPALMDACRRGVVAMIVFETSFFPAFRRALGVLGLERQSLDRIRVAAGTDTPEVRRAVERADFVYLSPLCDPALRKLAPSRASLILFDDHLADESLEELEAWLLLSGAGSLDRVPPTR